MERKLSDDELNLELKLTAFRKKVEDEKNKKLRSEAKREEIRKEKSMLYRAFIENFSEAGLLSGKYFFPVGLVNVFVFKSLFILPLTYTSGLLYFFMRPKNKIASE